MWAVWARPTRVEGTSHTHLGKAIVRLSGIGKPDTLGGSLISQSVIQGYVEGVKCWLWNGIKSRKATNIQWTHKEQSVVLWKDLL